MDALTTWGPFVVQFAGQAAIIYAAVQVLKAELRHVAERVERNASRLERHDDRLDQYSTRLATLEARR